MKTDSLNPDRRLLAAAKSLYGDRVFPAIEYRCDILRADKKGDISSPWAFSLNRVLPEMTPEAIASSLADILPDCRAENGFLNFTFDQTRLAGRIGALCDRFCTYLAENNLEIRPDDETEDFLPAYYLYRAAEAGADFRETDFSQDVQTRVAGLVAWCDILQEKKQRGALLSAGKILAEQVYLWDRSSREDISRFQLFGAAGLIFSLCV